MFCTTAIKLFKHSNILFQLHACIVPCFALSLLLIIALHFGQSELPFCLSVESSTSFHSFSHEPACVCFLVVKICKCQLLFPATPPPRLWTFATLPRSFRRRTAGCESCSKRVPKTVSSWSNSGPILTPCYWMIPRPSMESLASELFQKCSFIIFHVHPCTVLKVAIGIMWYSPLHGHILLYSHPRLT